MSTASPRPQLSLDELRRLKWLLGGALALVSLWTVFFLDVEALGLVAVASGLVVAVIVWPQLPARVPGLVWRLAVPAIVVAVAADFYLAAETLPALIRLAVLLVLYRAVTYRRKREDLQLIVLGLFLVVVAGVLTVSLEFALLLLAFTACALTFLFAVTLVDLVDDGPKVMRPEEMREVPPWARGGWRRPLARWREATDWRVVGFAAALFAGVVGVSALLFLAIPRFEIGSSFFFDKYITRKSRTGFTETVTFGSVSELVRDESVAMRIDVSDAAALPELPYLRLVVLDEYTPQGFRVSRGAKTELLATEQVRQSVRPKQTRRLNAVGGTWTFYVEPGVSRFFPLPGNFGTLRLRDIGPVQYSEAMRVGGLRTEPMAMMAFQLEGVELGSTVPDSAMARVLAEKRAGTLREGDPARRLLTALATPAGAENEATLARVVQEITRGEALDAARFAERASAWLQARHAYALGANVPRGGRDDVVKWLDSNEPGFCEFFAGSLAVLARAAGHPARVVAGFRGGTLNAFENYLMVKNSDAHAWVEIHDGGGLWFRVDPTLGGVMTRNVDVAAVAAVRQERDGSWAARLDTLRVFWYRRVVNFDTRQQVQLADAVKTATTGAGEALRARMEAAAKRLKAWLAGPWDGGRVTRALTGLALVIAVAWLAARGGGVVWRAWRRWRDPSALDPVRAEAGRRLVRLQARMARRLAAQPADAGDPRGMDSPEERAVLVDLTRLRYGARESWPEPHAVFRRARGVGRR
jgi:transglutaminase-like putative cysteine protease